MFWFERKPIDSTNNGPQCKVCVQMFFWKVCCGVNCSLLPTVALARDRPPNDQIDSITENPENDTNEQAAFAELFAGKSKEQLVAEFEWTKDLLRRRLEVGHTERHNVVA